MLAILLLFSCNHKQSDAAVERKRDVIYRRKDGMAQTMDVFIPPRRNGAAIMWILSGGYFSDSAPENAVALIKPFLDRGYTVFAVTHGSQPRYNVVEILEDVQAAAKYIRKVYRNYKIEPGKIGVYGASSGGHLALMMATVPIEGDPMAPELSEKQTFRMKAAAVIAAPSDYLNYGKSGISGLGEGPLARFKGAFDFSSMPSKSVSQIGREISPINHVTADDAPTIIFHGDKDELVPLQQSQIFQERMKAAGVPCELVVKPGGGHDFRSMSEYLADMERAADWFDHYMNLPGKSKK